MPATHHAHRSTTPTDQSQDRVAPQRGTPAARRSPFGVAESLYAGRMSIRYGVTIPGLVLAGGTGVYLGIQPFGYIGLVVTPFTDPAALLALPGALLFGALLGLGVAYLSRNRIKPKLDRAKRYRLAALLGAVTLPGYVFVAHFPGADGDGAGNRWPVGFAFCCGIATMIVYYQRRKRLALAQHARRLANQEAERQSATR
jgi:hypothetical protein